MQYWNLHLIIYWATNVFLVEFKLKFKNKKKNNYSGAQNIAKMGIHP